MRLSNNPRPTSHTQPPLDKAHGIREVSQHTAKSESTIPANQHRTVRVRTPYSFRFPERMNSFHRDVTLRLRRIVFSVTVTTKPRPGHDRRLRRERITNHKAPERRELDGESFSA
jgi:hypothetical protein